VRGQADDPAHGATPLRRRAGQGLPCHGRVGGTVPPNGACAPSVRVAVCSCCWRSRSGPRSPGGSEYLDRPPRRRSNSCRSPVARMQRSGIRERPPSARHRLPRVAQRLPRPRDSRSPTLRAPRPPTSSCALDQTSLDGQRLHRRFPRGARDSVQATRSPVQDEWFMTSGKLLFRILNAHGN
jgi:hypothetical protein